MEKFLKQILAKLEDMESDIKGLKTDVGGIKPKVEELYTLKPKIEELYALKPKNEESHQWLSALYHNSQVHKAEIEQMNHKVATIEGVLTGVANSLEPFKKAQ